MCFVNFNGFTVRVNITSNKKCCLVQSEALQQKTEEAQQLRERVTSLELSMSGSSEEKAQCEVRRPLVSGCACITSARLLSEYKSLVAELKKH